MADPEAAGRSAAGCRRLAAVSWTQADGRSVGIVEAKKLTIGPQNVLAQAERYAKGLSETQTGGGGCPFLYSTNGEVIWFHDVRHELNRSRRIKALHTPSALKELLARDDEAAQAKLEAMPHDHPRLRPYQLEASAATDKALRMRTVMQANLSIDREDFDYQDALVRHGGWGAARCAFGADRPEDLLHRLNEAIAA